MKPESPEVIRAKAADILAKLHVLDGQLEAGSPMPAEAYRSLITARSIMARIIRREEEKKNVEAA